jgi:hypothetical protein
VTRPALLALAFAINRALDVAPVVILAGVYGTCFCALTGIAPPWVGFVAGAVPVAALAVWAFWPEVTP